MTELNTLDYITITLVLITIISISCSCYNPSIYNCYSSNPNSSPLCDGRYQYFSCLSTAMIVITYIITIINISTKNTNLGIGIALSPIILSLISFFSSGRR
jgi:hypothetical protein